MKYKIEYHVIENRDAEIEANSFEDALNTFLNEHGDESTEVDVHTITKGSKTIEVWHNEIPNP